MSGVYWLPKQSGQATNLSNQSLKMTDYISHFLNATSMIILSMKPIEPAPSAKKIQKVPARPASDVLEMSHIIKNKNAINIGNKTYSPQLVTVLDAIANMAVSYKSNHHVPDWRQFLIMVVKIIGALTRTPFVP